MLQRTRAEQAAEVFNLFIEKFPTIHQAATANPDELTAVLHSLGLHHRIPRFIALFKELMINYGGNIPSDPKELMKLPGVGRYIAHAVLCFGFGQQVPVVDVNIARVLSRFFGIRSIKKRPHTDPVFWEYANRLIKLGNAMDINEAMLDFASLICLKKPRCGDCPVKSMCAFFNDSPDTSRGCQP